MKWELARLLSDDIVSRAIVLFDLDGTLLLTGGASTRCIKSAARRVIGEAFSWKSVTPGTLDSEIFSEVAAGCGIDNALYLFDQYKRIYLEDLEVELQRRMSDVIALPGVRELIQSLSRRSDVIVGLLTGNFRRAAELKLAAAGIDRELFSVAAFAEDGIERPDLIPAALARLNQKRQMAPLDARQVILVGDTPQDINCARRSGCRVLAVATGQYSVDALASHHPDRVAADLRDPRPLNELIELAVDAGGRA